MEKPYLNGWFGGTTSYGNIQINIPTIQEFRCKNKRLFQWEKTNLPSDPIFHSIDPWNCCQNTELKPRSMFRCRLRHFSLPPSVFKGRVVMNCGVFWILFFQGGWKVKGDNFPSNLCVPGTKKRNVFWKNGTNEMRLMNLFCLFGEKMVELNQKVIWVIPWSQCSQWARTFTFLVGESATL